MSSKANEDANTNIRVFLIFYIYVINNFKNVNKKIEFTAEVKQSIKDTDKIREACGNTSMTNSTYINNK